MDFPSLIEPLESRIAPATLSIANVSVIEGNSGTKTAVFTVSLDAPATDVISVDCSTSDGAGAGGALDGIDYSSASGSLHFQVGDQSLTFTVDVIGDTTPAENKIFNVQLSNPTGADLGNALATGTILNDDVSAGTEISVADVTHLEGNSGTSNADFVITLSKVQAFPVTVHYATANGIGGTGATAGTDYTNTFGDLTFAAGETSKTISVPVIGDTVAAADKTFSFDLSSPGNAVLTKTSATGKILNDDTKISIADVTLIEGDSGTKNASFVVTLDAATTFPVTFHYTTVNGTGPNGAISGTDYNALSGDITFAAGQTSKIINVAVIGNTVAGLNKQFTVELSSAVNAQIATSTGTGTILNDDLDQPVISADHKQFSFTDLDGDLVTVTSSKPLFTSQSVINSAFQFRASATDPQRFQLEGVDFTKLDASLQVKSDLTISAVPALSGLSDGFVNVGFIDASTDLGSIRITGDLGKIVVGDNVKTQGLKLLDVRSMGAQGTATGASNLISNFKGPVGTIHIGQDLDGARLNILNVGGVLGSGSLSKLLVDGAIRGGSSADSGKVVVDGKLSSATIGSIVGGAGANSGSVVGNYVTQGSIGTINLLGSLTGGAGFGSGTIVAPQISNVDVAGNIQGGSGDASGVLQAGISLGKVHLAGSLIGGDFVDSTHQAFNAGQIFGATISSLTIDRDVIGKSGIGSGMILSTGQISYVKVIGSLIGGTAGTAAVPAVEADPNANPPVVAQAAQPAKSGSSGVIRADQLKTVIIGGSIIGGNGVSNSQTAQLSGAVVGDSSIGSLTVGSSSSLNSGRIIGGTALFSGYVQAAKIGTVTVYGDLVGNSGSNSGKINSVGTIDKVVISGSILGGTGSDTGAISAPGGIKSVIIDGNITGNTGFQSGSVVAINGSVLGASGAISNIQVKGNVTGGGSVNGANGNQSGAISAGSLGKVTIGGNLVGGEGNSSGEVFSNSTIDSIIVSGGITGGGGELSGSIVTNQGRISQAKVGLGIQGGQGDSSGFINSDSIGKVTVGGKVIGGGGTSSGAIHSDQTSIDSVSLGGLEGGSGENSGTLFAKGLSNVKITADVIGGEGDGSGNISSLGGDIKGITLTNLKGGTGNHSGQILTDGILSGAKILGDVIGGNSSNSAALTSSGYIQARQIASLVVSGSVKAGTSGTESLTDSGTIRATENIVSLTAGNLMGSATNAVIIAAQGFLGQTPGTPTNVAIQTLKITGNVSKAEILAGYGLVDTSDPDVDPVARGTAVNADAQIGTISVGGTWDVSSVAAGVLAGDDGQFGTADDELINTANSYNAPDVFSRISSIIVNGASLDSSLGASNFGIVAQYIVEAKFNRVAVPLTIGFPNDAVEITPGGNFLALEVGTP